MMISQSCSSIRQPLLFMARNQANSCSSWRKILPACCRSYSTTRWAAQRKVAIVGSGPSGCYTAKYLRAAWDKSGDENDATNTIDIIERLPTPYGLVRFGVAPDHPEVKNVQNDFNSLFEESNKRIQFLGNVQVGRDVSLDELRKRYDAVILATGCESCQRLGLPNEENLSGVLSAREFVAWYNGHPDYAHIGAKVEAALSTSSSGSGTDGEDNDAIVDASVVVVGQGNVALDCARVLAKGGRGLFDTDIASHTLPILKGGVSQITVVGRRGHIQGAFTIKELRELVQLQEEGHDTLFVVREDELEMGTTPTSIEELNAIGGRPKQRIDKLLRKAASGISIDEERNNTASKRIDLRFLTSPTAWEPAPDDTSRLGTVVCERTRLQGESGRQKAVGTGELERIPAQLALVSIGYKAVAIPGMDQQFFYDEDQSQVRHEQGRIDAPAATQGGLYASGWFKRGPSGIIGTNIPDARETVASVLQDMEMSSGVDSGARPLVALLQERGVEVVDWAAYQRIEMQEAHRKRSPSQPREKVTDFDELIDIAKDK